NATAPSNFRLVLSDGTSVPVPPGSIDLAFSNQLLEHLHPDDVPTHLRNVHESLAPGGAYFFITPHRAGGPHDVSADFDSEATGFHLHEYTTQEASRLCRSAGFSRTHAVVGARGTFLPVPAPYVTTVESMLWLAPRRARRAIARSRLVSNWI